MAGAGGCIDVPDSWYWYWWQLLSPSDDAGVMVVDIDAEGCWFVSGGICVVVVRRT